MTDINDPAWFYSSMAQSCASIVGLIGGILVARFVEHLSQMRMEKARTWEKVLKLIRRIQGHNEQFSKYQGRMERDMEACRKALSEGLNVYHIRERREWHDSGSIVNGDVDPKLHIAHCEAMLRPFLPVIKAYPKLFSPITLESPVRFKDTMEGLMNELPADAREAVREDISDFLSLGSYLIVYRRQLVPGPFVAVLSVLAWLTVFGIMLPLSYLPAHTHSRQLTLLGLMSFGLVGLIGYLGYQLHELKRLGDFEWYDIE